MRLVFESLNGKTYIYNHEEKQWYELGKTESLPLDIVYQAKELLCADPLL